MEKKSNKAIGNNFEEELSELLSKLGFWVHRLAPNASGQPADIIAVKNGQPVLIDCKVCSNNRFMLSRVEENQELAMNYWNYTGNDNAFFALKSREGKIYMIPFSVMMELKQSGELIIMNFSPFDTFERWYDDFRSKTNGNVN